MHLGQAAKLVHQDLSDGEASFSGSFGKDCQTESVPKSLLMLVQMILEGTSLSLAADNQTKNRLELSQLFNFNALKRQRDQKVVNVRHRYSEITALPVYTGLLLHSCTRKKSIIDKVSAFGLSISYNRVDEIQSAITDQVCREYQTKGLVRPIGLADSVFTTAAIDNVDHNVIFTGQASHCFNILIHRKQTIKSCLTCQVKHWVDRGTLNSPLITQKITPVGAVKSHCPIKTINSEVTKRRAHPVQMCNKWLKFVDDVNCGSHKETVTRTSDWGAYHQECSEQIPSVPTGQALYDGCAGHVPVITADQPVYALLKQI